ncbi:MAG: 2-hydroxymuconic semialdehyde dehydrogenase [Myxococcota bacterium]|nr:2-hydroxymuconic semialdehyde dehydrogenase [Myxococcota bacterium]
MPDVSDRKLFIDGKFCLGSGERFANINPATGAHLGFVEEAKAADVGRAVAAAKAALSGPWGRMPQAERLALLGAAAQGICDRFDDFLEAEVADTGKPLSWARKVDIPRGAANLQLFADITRNIANESYITDTPDGGKAINYAMRQPLGVVGVICPWNLPLLLMTWKVGPALAAGNTVVVKPSEETPSTATLLAEVMNDIGMPPGVYNVVHGFGPGSAGQALVQHKDVAAITFTGESSTGIAIMKDAAPTLKPLSFELGGKNPAIIFADADFDDAVAGTLRSSFSNCGQVCLCSERVYVERPIFERFVAAMKEGAEKLRYGAPMDEGTEMGPLISAQHRDKVLSYYQLARDEGANVVCGGGVPQLDDELSGGSWVEPTIITGLGDEARCVREEIFGPICHISPFDSEEEVIGRANDTEYGLCAAVWTGDLKRGHRMAAALDCGLVWLNSWFLRDLRTPFGGTGASGIGREGGIHSVNFYSELKNVCVKL